MKRAHKIIVGGMVATGVVGAALFLLGGPSLFGGAFHEYGDKALRLSADAYERNEKANDELIETWLQYQLFSWKWWLNVGLAVVPWTFWALVRRKASTHRLLYVGFCLVIAASFLDFLGVTYGVWRYHMELFPSMPSYTPWDFTLYPVAGMLLFQWEPQLSKYWKALWFAVSGGLVVEPLFVWLQIYEPVHWSVLYSLPVHFLVYLLADWLGTRTEFEPLTAEPVPKWEPPEVPQRSRD